MSVLMFQIPLNNDEIQENQFLWWKKAEIEKWSIAAQKQAGYVLDHPYVGHCNETNPIDLFRANDISIE